MAMSRRAALACRIAALSLLAVVAGTSRAEGRFAVSGDGQEVTDSANHLTWRRCAEGMHWDGKTCAGKLLKFSYGGAKKAAATARSDARAWRIPTREELVGLVDKTTKKKPRIDVDAFPKTPNSGFWASRAGSDDDLNAWLVSFGNGKVTGNVGQAKFPLRLVRAAP